MKNAYIKFHTKEDSVLGFYELVTHAPVSRLTNDIFCIPWANLAVLDARQVKYSFASEEDMRNAHPIWNFTEAPTKANAEN